MKTRLLIPALACLWFTSCTNRPVYVLPDKKMEDVLFDLYLAETEIKENSYFFYGDSLRKQELLQSVFEKHHITQAKFDTSLVWYNANLDKYLKINTRLAERYNLLLTGLQEEQERIRIASTVIDTTIFYTSGAFWLRNAGRERIHAFIGDSTIVKATQYQKYDITLTALGIKDAGRLALTFCIQCPDTHYVYHDTIRQNGPFTVQYLTPGGRRATSVYGTLCLPDTAVNPVLVTRFSISQQNTVFRPLVSEKEPILSR